VQEKTRSPSINERYGFGDRAKSKLAAMIPNSQSSHQPSTNEKSRCGDGETATAKTESLFALSVSATSGPDLIETKNPHQQGGVPCSLKRADE